MIDFDAVGKIRTHFGYVIGRNVEAVKDGGDEGDSTAEGLGEHYVIFDENVVAVVTNDQTAGVSISSHFEMGLRVIDDRKDVGGIVLWCWKIISACYWVELKVEEVDLD